MGPPLLGYVFQSLAAALNLGNLLQPMEDLVRLVQVLFLAISANADDLSDPNDLSELSDLNDPDDLSDRGDVVISGKPATPAVLA